MQWLLLALKTVLGFLSCVLGSWLLMGYWLGWIGVSNNGLFKPHSNVKRFLSFPIAILLTAAVHWSFQGWAWSAIAACCLFAIIICETPNIVRNMLRNIKIAIKARRQLREAEKGDERAMISFGSYCFHKKNRKKGIDWWEKAASLGNVDAMLSLGWYYGLFSWRDPNWEKAIEWWEKAAKLGSVDAMWRLGWRYGIKMSSPNEEKAVEWWRKAASCGDAASMLRLGEYYQRKNDPSEAAKWREEAKRLNNTRAQAARKRLEEKGAHAARLGAL